MPSLAIEEDIHGRVDILSKSIHNLSEYVARCATSQQLLNERLNEIERKLYEREGHSSAAQLVHVEEPHAEVLHTLRELHDDQIKLLHADFKLKLSEWDSQVKSLVQHMQGLDSQLQGKFDNKRPENMPEASGGSDHLKMSEAHLNSDADRTVPDSEIGESRMGEFTFALPQHPHNSRTSEENEALDCGRNLHAWCIVHATKHLANPFWALSLMIFSNFFVVWQLFLLASCILESSFSRCSSHDHCELGEWCSPALAGTFSTSPGVCFDCWSAAMFYKARFLNASYEVYPDPYELMADAAGDTWLIDGSLHCNATDTRARRCDYLVDNLQNMTPLSMLIFVAMAGLITATLVDELDQIEDCELLAWDRLIVASKQRSKYILMALSWLACSLRRWVLPMMTVGACLGLTLREPLSAANLLLNGLSIAFVTTLDESLISLIYFPFRNLKNLQKYPVSIRTWIFHRVYACLIFAAFLGTVLRAEELLVTHGNEKKYGAVCSDLREIVTVFSYYVCLAFAILHALLRLYLRFRSKTNRVPQRLSSKLSSLQLRESGVRPNDIVFDLAQFMCELLIPAFLVWYFRDAFVAQGPLVLLQIGDVVGWFSD